MENLIVNSRENQANNRERFKKKKIFFNYMPLNIFKWFTENFLSAMVWMIYDQHYRLYHKICITKKLFIYSLCVSISNRSAERNGEVFFLPIGISFISILAPSLRGGIFRLLPKSATCQRKEMYLGCRDIIWNSEYAKYIQIN